MASGVADDNVSDDFMSCHICLDNYKDPRVLPCHHTFCLGCLQGHAASNGDKGGKFPCPLCRRETQTPEDGLKQLPNNLFMEEMKMSRTNLKMCDLCEDDKSLYFCPHCGQYICRGCKGFHDDVNIGHVLKDVAEVLDQDNEDGVISEQYPLAVDQLTNITARLGNTLVNLKDKLKTAEEERSKYLYNRKVIYQRLKQQAHQLKVAIDTQCEEIVKETDTVFKEKLSQLAHYTSKVQGQHKQVEGVYAEAIRLQSTSPISEVESGQVQVLEKQTLDLEQQEGEQPEPPDQLKVLYTATALPVPEDVRAMIGKVESTSHGMMSPKEAGNVKPKPEKDLKGANSEESASRIERLLGKTKTVAKKTSEFQLRKQSSGTYTNIAVSTTGDVFVLFNQFVEVYTADGKFLFHFNIGTVGWIPYRLTLHDTTKNTDMQLVVCYHEVNKPRSQCLHFSIPQIQTKKSCEFDGYLYTASCGDIFVLLTGQGDGSLKFNYYNHNTPTAEGKLSDKQVAIREKPSDIAIDKEENVFLLYGTQYYAIMMDISGRVRFTYGSKGVPGDGPGQLSNPQCICTDSKGHVYIGDQKKIVVFSSDDGRFIGNIDGIGVSRPMFQVDSRGQLIIIEGYKIVKYMCDDYI